MVCVIDFSNASFHGGPAQIFGFATSECTRFFLAEVMKGAEQRRGGGYDQDVHSPPIKWGAGGGGGRGSLLIVCLSSHLGALCSSAWPLGLMCDCCSAVPQPSHCTQYTEPLPVIAWTPYAIVPRRKCIASLRPLLPAQKGTVATSVCCWLQRSVHWDNYRHASFHVAHDSPHTEWRGDWSTD